MRPAIPPPMIATEGSSDNGAVNMTCSWLKDFLRIDLRPNDDFLGFLEVCFWPCIGLAFLGLGFGLEPETRVMGRRDRVLGSAVKKVAMGL